MAYVATAKDAAGVQDATDQLDGALHSTIGGVRPNNNKTILQEDRDAFYQAESLERQEAETALQRAKGEKEFALSTAAGTTTSAAVSVAKEAAPADTNGASFANPSKRFVTPKDFELLKVIGMGAFGKVLQVRNKRSKQTLAMKVISKRLLRRKAGYVENVQAERNILTRIRHPFVVTMHCSFQSREKLFILMDFLAGGELFLRLGREGIFLEKTAAFYLAETICALDYLHQHGVLHRDLKPENILLGSDGHVVLTDFGLSKDYSRDGGFQNEQDDSRAVTVCGTQEYMAPEMIARQGYGRAADYWSLGCIAFEMLSGEPPFNSKNGAKDLFRKIMTEKVKMPVGSTAPACKLLKGLLNRNVQSRLGTARSTMFEVGGSAGLKNAEFFAKIDWEKLERKEIEPPETLPVDHDEDLRHFHDEFTQMPLPRSVVEMSLDNFSASRVESEHFRGFSFIQDDFVLPDRPDGEVKYYWETAEEDGESVSDCASSKHEGESVDPVIKEDTAAQKKKRPPRKRNRKKGAADSTSCTPVSSAAATPVASAETTPMHSAINTPAPSENGDAEPAKPAMKAPLVLVPKPPAPVPPSPPVVLATPPPPKPSRKAVQQSWQPVYTPSKKESCRSAANSNNFVSKTKTQQQAPAQNGRTQASPRRSVPGLQPVARQPHTQPKQNSGWKPAPSYTAPRRPSGPQSGPGPHQSNYTGGGSMPSSDWRQHPLRSSPGNSSNGSLRSLVDPPNLWPSLGPDPPLSQTPTKATTATATIRTAQSPAASTLQSSTTKKLHGAWATKKR
jgi:p70 ribosomal S6 kinase